MEWFKHGTGSHDDPDISEAIDKFGDKAYSIFFMTLEIYAKEYSRLKDGKLTLTKRTWMRKLRKKWKLIENVWSFYAECNRFDFISNENIATIKIPKFIELASNWTVRTNHPPPEAPAEAPTAIESEEESEEEHIYINHSSNSIYNRDNGNLTDNDFKINFSKGYQVLDLIKKIINKPYSNNDGIEIKRLLKNLNPVVIKSIIEIARKSKKPIVSYLWFIKSFSQPLINVPFEAISKKYFVHNCGTKDNAIYMSKYLQFKCTGCGEIWDSVAEFEKKTNNKISNLHKDSEIRKIIEQREKTRV